MRIIIVSNRLPVSVKETPEGDIIYESSAGGLATGIFSWLNSFKEKGSADSATEYFWVGSAGGEISADKRDSVREKLMKEYRAIPVFLTEEENDLYYHGFSNNTIWPLFHYFPVYTEYREETWESYKKVNLKFAAAAASVLEDEDILWIHDYQLMLLPAMIRAEKPSVTMGYFHHIPFPSFEIFRLLPARWRGEIIEGLLGADLIGFHTNDYSRHFMSCVLRISGHDANLGNFLLKDRMVRTDTFPMGINYRQFSEGVLRPEVMSMATALKENFPEQKIILSIDRLDYSKGILNRLEGYEKFLETHPEWHGRTVLILTVVPSRVSVPLYADMKRQIDEIAGKINGQFGNISWSPIVYQFRSLNFNELLAVYSVSDAALVTPLRDGMNLIAKEYTASQQVRPGVLILSEMAGAAKEMGEAVIINPNHREEIAEAIHQALIMEDTEKRHRLNALQQRIRIYDVIRWASDFFTQLTAVKKEQQRYKARILSKDVKDTLIKNYIKSTKRLFALDYDGTLTGFVNKPEDAVPGEHLLNILKDLTEVPGNQVWVVSGRDRAFLEKNLGNPGTGFIAEHGAWIRHPDGEWVMPRTLQSSWMEPVRSVMQLYSDRLPGSFIEQKNYSVAIHYRRCDPEYSSFRIKELADELITYTANINVQVLQGNKVLEVRNAGVNKGEGVASVIREYDPDFILCAGDDWTDEDMFSVLPDTAWSLKAGPGNSGARFNISGPSEMVRLLGELTENPPE